jgi:ABC-2 type transport system permease protein
MSKIHNLTTVIKHEILSTLKQPAFWLTVFGIPLMMIAILGVTYLSGKSSDDRVRQASNELENIVVIDHSGIINKQIADSMKIDMRTDQQSNLLQVKQGKLAGLIVYPADIAKTRTTQIYVNAGDNSLMASSSLDALAAQLFTRSLLAPLGNDERIQLAQTPIGSNVTTYKDGHQNAGFAEYIIPGAFLVMFYIMMVLSLPNIINSVSEEKENRVMELLITSVTPRVLIIGKLLALAILTVLQISLLAGLAGVILVVAQQFGGDSFNLPFKLSDLVFDPTRIMLGLGFFTLGYMLFAALVLGTSSIMPSAKEANGLSGIFMLGGIIPFYMLSTLMTDPDSLASKILSFFPLTSQASMLMRNTVGAVNVNEALFAMALTVIWVILAFVIAIWLFNHGALSYGTRPTLFHKRKQK